MCDDCVERITQGTRPPVTERMWELAGLAWDWYQLDGNDVGGALHITLDDYNIEDGHLDFCASRLGEVWLDGEQRAAPAEYVELGGKIIEGLRELTEPERAMVAHVADPYGPTRPQGGTNGR